MHDVSLLLDPIRRLHEHVRDAVVGAFDSRAVEELSGVAEDGEGDTIYAVDRVSEEIVIEFFSREVATIAPVVLVAEGIAGGSIVLPEGAHESDAVWRIIVDPIDGTRCLMYQKRSGWILTGVAPNKGPTTTLADIELAVQTEIPIAKQYLSDVAWARRGGGAFAERFDRLSGARSPLVLRPSSAATIEHGYACISRFFPGARDELAAIDEAVVRRTVGPVRAGKAHCFEDQYTSSGGQLFELMCGHDRFIADLRPLVEPLLHARGEALGICCHPYDVCTELIARELGVIVTDPFGRPLTSLLSVEPDVAWVGYANARIRSQVEPALRDVLRERGLLVFDEDVEG